MSGGVIGRILLALAYALGWAPMFLFRTETVRDALPHYSPEERLATWLTPAVFAVHATLACLLISLEPLPASRIVAGAALQALALGFWSWGRRMISPFRVRRLPQEPPARLRRDGPFAIVRHPLYFSFILAALAPVVATRSGYLVATFATSFAAVALRAILEERRLREQLGAEYDDYSQQVKRLIPFVW